MQIDRQLIARLDNATQEFRLLSHPFYRAWADGTLTGADLAFYSTQYWRQVEAFPRYLSDLADRVPSPETRAILIDNLRDEVEDDHARLWLDFANALGVPDAEVKSSVAEEETRACTHAFGDATASSSIPLALGMLYGYESQTPEVAETKVAGLRAHYGIEGAGVTYFELHGKLDLEHSNELARAVTAEAATDADRREAVEGARRGAAAISRLLDGVARVREIT